MSRLICLCRDSLFLWGMVKHTVLRSAHQGLWQAWGGGAGGLGSVRQGIELISAQAGAEKLSLARSRVKMLRHLPRCLNCLHSGFTPSSALCTYDCSVNITSAISNLVPWSCAKSYPSFQADLSSSFFMKPFLIPSD